jgi:CBS domain-containing protein
MRQLADIVLNQDPLTMPASTTVVAACQQMRDRRVGSILVTGQDGSLFGIFTGRDAVWRVIAAGKSATTTTLGEVMTPNPDTMSPGTTAIEALRLMWDGGFRHIPVVKEGRIVGIVSRGDFKGMEQDRLDEERELWEHMR